jgi:hypothetical protein
VMRSAGHRDSLRVVCVRASMVAASHQNAPVNRAESENGVYECRSDVNGEREVKYGPTWLFV